MQDVTFNIIIKSKEIIFTTVSTASIFCFNILFLINTNSLFMRSRGSIL